MKTLVFGGVSLIGSGLIHAWSASCGERVVNLEKLNHDQAGLGLAQAEVSA